MQTMQWKDLKSMTARELTDAVVELGEKKFRAGQIYGWLHKKLVRDVGKISNVSPAFLERLTKQYPLYGVSQAACLASKLDGTRKYLFELHDGNVIESLKGRYEANQKTFTFENQVNVFIDTMFLITSLEYAYLSSTTVKEVAQYGGDLERFVFPFIADLLRERVRK